MRRGYTASRSISYCLVVMVVLVCTWSRFSGIACGGSIYDKPLSVRHTDLKPDPQNPRVKRNISCYDYEHFVVKQIDFGEVGADSLSIIPVGKDATVPCRQARERNEYVIPSDTWSGYFEGARSDYLFFRAADGINGGLGFMVFSSAGKKKLFEDVAEKGIQVIDTDHGVLKLRYQRVSGSKCSAVTGGAACRDTIAKETGVSGGSLSSCAGSYQAAKEQMAKMRCESQKTNQSSCVEKELKVLDGQKWNAAPTVIVYDVEVVVGGASPVIKPLGDALACRPSD